jgi:soluble lytic murein transglycosylase-like protein
MTPRSVRCRWRRGTGALAALAVVAAASSSAFGRPAGYTIRSGDTVGALAARYGVTESAIVSANQLADRNRIYAGQTLVIPLAPSADPEVTAGGGGSAPSADAPRVPLAPVAWPALGGARFPAELLGSPRRRALLPSFRHWAAVYGVPTGLVEAVGWMESGWQAKVVSKTHAVGIGQIEPLTGVFISTQLLGLSAPLDARVPDNNIRMSAAYLSWLLHQTNGDVANALGGYYQGLTTLRAKGPLRTTRRYVAGVGSLWSLFRSG